MKKLTSQGYKRIWQPKHPLADKHGCVLEHRMVYYNHFGPIPTGHQIHHKNGIKTDNRIANLVAMSNSQHQLEHQKEGTLVKNQHGTFVVKPVAERISTKAKNKAIVRACVWCGASYNMKRSDAKYCSSACRVAKCKKRALQAG